MKTRSLPCLADLIRHAARVLPAFIAVALSSCGGSQPSPPPLIISPASLSNAMVGAPYSSAISANGGVAPYNWSVSAGNLPHNLTLEASGSTATISGTPDATQSVNFTIQVSDSAQQFASQTYTVSVLLDGDSIIFSPPSVDFGGQLVGTASALQRVTMTNNSVSPVTISGITTVGNNGSDFVQNTTCTSSLAPGANCMIREVFTPGQLGPSVASITINDDAQGSPQSVPLSGVGLVSGANATLSGTSLAFGSVAVGDTSQAQSVRLTNYGTSTLNITSIAASPSFTETNDCGAVLASAASCTIDLTFSPVATGTVSGTLTLSYTGPSSPQTASLSGSGVAGSCSSRGQNCSDTKRCCSGLTCRVINVGLNVYAHICTF